VAWKCEHGYTTELFLAKHFDFTAFVTGIDEKILHILFNAPVVLISLAIFQSLIMFFMPLPTSPSNSQYSISIRTHNLIGRAAAGLRLRPRSHWDRHYVTLMYAF
jgi:hypothetical protein